MPSNPIASKHIVGGHSVGFYGPGTEATLDIEVMYYGNHAATLYFWNNNGWIYQWAVTFVNSNERPEAASISWGTTERTTCAKGNCNEGDAKSYNTETNA